MDHALLFLRKDVALPETEVELNRKFYFCLLAANRELYPENDIAPIPECNNQPDPDDKSRVMREHKRPDFQWIYLDRYESDPHRSSKQFVIECKRIGESLRTDWILNSNYVAHGVCRFHDAEWAYGQRFPSGAMVGYWQSMEPQEVLREINAASRESSLPELTLIEDWGTGDVSRLEHTFQRPFIVSPFALRHRWIDLRSSISEE